MLLLKDITKSYTTGGFTQVALDHVSLQFRKSEFVAILGQSGSGKTTCLNVIGGLDHYDSGDLIFNGTSTKNYKDKEWDAYRNNSVGFIFQNYNLISHLSIVDNVEMGMTLSGVSSKAKHKKAMEVLERVGLRDHIHKKPNQLSGGQMQRVAIARALANDPDIILADEPTGALDSVTSEQIMDLIKEISAGKLVIMVTHNPELAEKYADRIVRFKDGKVMSDSSPCEQTGEDAEYSLKKTSMSFFTALNLSGRNIATKKWRTALTSFAASIGIIGIALILSLSSGFQIQIDQFQSDALAEFPITVSQSAMKIDADSMAELQGNMEDNPAFPEGDAVYLYDSTESAIVHENNITEDYLTYLEDIDPAICRSIGYTRLVGMNLLCKADGKAQPASVAVGINMGGGNSADTASMASMSSMSGAGLASYPEPLQPGEESYLSKNYDVLAGSLPSKITDLVLVVDSHNRVDFTVLQNLGYDTEGVECIKFSEIVGKELKLIPNDEYYQQTPQGNFLPNTDYESMYDSPNALTLKISGVVRIKEDTALGFLGNGIAYSDGLTEKILEMEKDSQIVQAQRAANYNVINTEQLDEDGKKSMLAHLGGDATPFMVYIYPVDFEAKEAVLSYLDAYNNGKAEADTILYSDLASTMTDMTGGIMDAITLVLVAFASISLIVSLIMIGIITYISVLERTREIGVLRALGARKKDITRVFNAETFIIGACSGLLGIVIAYLLTIPVNIVLKQMTGLSSVAQLNPLHALALVTISIILTLIGGMIPARIAAKKDPVEALRTE